jgi:hypothetical protein
MARTPRGGLRTRGVLVDGPVTGAKNASLAAPVILMTTMSGEDDVVAHSARLTPWTVGMPLSIEWLQALRHGRSFDRASPAAAVSTTSAALTSRRWNPALGPAPGFQEELFGESGAS